MKGLRLTSRLCTQLLRRSSTVEASGVAAPLDHAGGPTFSSLNKDTEAHTSGAATDGDLRHDHGPPAKPLAPPEAEASSMGTGSALNPPPGQSFGDGNFAAASQGDNPAARTPASSTASGVLDSTRDAIQEANSMSTGSSSMSPPAGSGFEAMKQAAGGAQESTEGAVGSVVDKAESVLFGTGKDPAARGFSSWARGFLTSASVGAEADRGGVDTHTAPGPGKDAEEPIDAGVVSQTATGPNVLGGTPMKDPKERLGGTKLQDDTERMMPPTDTKSAKMGIEHSGTGNRYFSTSRYFFNETGCRTGMADEEDLTKKDTERDPKDPYDKKRTKEHLPAEDMPGSGPPATPDAQGLGVSPPGAKRVGNPQSAADADSSNSERAGA